MAPIDTTLDDRIIGLLREAGGKELAMRDIEKKLEQLIGERINTFDVRDAVWRLIAKRKADFTPLRDVILVNP